MLHFVIKKVHVKLLFCFQVGLQLGVIPREAGKVVVGFGIQYQYTNTVFALGMYLFDKLF